MNCGFGLNIGMCGKMVDQVFEYNGPLVSAGDLSQLPPEILISVDNGIRRKAGPKHRKCLSEGSSWLLEYGEATHYLPVLQKTSQM